HDQRKAQRLLFQRIHEAAGRLADLCNRIDHASRYRDRRPVEREQNDRHRDRDEEANQHEAAVSPHRLVLWFTLSVSPFTTDLSPVLNVPADHSVPAVLSTVLTAPLPNTRNAPLTVPLPVIANDSAAESAFDPAEADDQAA